MKFLADMGISPRTVAKLRQEGYDAVHYKKRSPFRESNTSHSIGDRFTLASRFDI